MSNKEDVVLDTLNKLKESGEAPDWLQIEGYLTLKSGYLLPNETPKGMYTRVSKAAASYYENHEYWADKFFDVMWKNWLCCSSPVLSNMGTYRGLPISCNSVHVGDNLDSIFMKNHELAMLSKNGAGVGIYLGDIRGRGANIKGNGSSQGIVNWAKIYDTTTLSVNQGCYDDQTELLTEKGWLPFSEIENQVGKLKVAQVTKDKALSFTHFTNFVKYKPEEKLIRLSNSNIEILVTQDHTMVFERRQRISNKRTSDGKFSNHTKKFSGYLERSTAVAMPKHDIRIPVGAKYIVPDSYDSLSYLQRFQIAFQADATTSPTGNSTGVNGTIMHRFNFIKQRKIDRLTLILDNLGFSYSKNQGKEGNTYFYVAIPTEIVVSKKFSDMFSLVDLNHELALDFIKEASLWDGSSEDTDTVYRYFSTNESNVNFIQALAAMVGLFSSKNTKTREKEENRVTLYSTYVSKNSGGSYSSHLTREFVDYSGFVYCVSVPEQTLVIRRKGHTFLCGNSTRRGASAVYLPIDHIDIEEFLHIRRPTGDMNKRCLNINQGVCIPNYWMEEMLAGDADKRVLWQNILKERYETGEPYLFFTDNVNKANPDCYTDKNLDVKTSNICTEIFLHTDPDHSFVCCLSSLNLTKWFEWKDTDLVNTSVRFLDAVLNEYIKKSENIPGLEASRRSAIKGRAIGIGVLGWHTFLQDNMIPFDSFDAMSYNNQIFKSIREKAEEETTVMAKELGEPEWCVGHNRRHTHLLAVAPTVSNSLISGGHSAGIEPIAANFYAQQSAKGTFIRKNSTLEKLLESKGNNIAEIWKSINEQAGSVQHLTFLSAEEKAVFLTAREINQHAIIRQAAQRQKWIDQGQSINLFFGSNSDPKYIHEVHIEAWRSGLKSLYYFRAEGVIRGDLASRSKEECSACEG